MSVPPEAKPMRPLRKACQWVRISAWNRVDHSAAPWRSALPPAKRYCRGWPPLYRRDAGYEMRTAALAGMLSSPLVPATVPDQVPWPDVVEVKSVTWTNASWEGEGCSGDMCVPHWEDTCVAIAAQVVLDGAVPV